MRAIIVLSAVLLTLLSACASDGDRPPKTEQPATKRATGDSPPPHVNAIEPIQVGPFTVAAEIAGDADSRSRGLAGRTELAPHSGMLFIYSEPETRTFWMKGCLIGLDIAFLDENRRIFQIESLDPPEPGMSDSHPDYPRAESARAAQFVLEVEKGWFAERAVVPGTVVRFPKSLERRVSELELR